MIGKLLTYFNLHWWLYDVRYEDVPGSSTILFITTRTCQWCGLVEEGHDFKWVVPECEHKWMFYFRYDDPNDMHSNMTGLRQCSKCRCSEMHDRTKDEWVKDNG